MGVDGGARAGMTKRPCTLMVDTNVWLDIYLPARPNREDSLRFFEAASGDDVNLVFTLEIARSVFRVVSHEAKRWVRQGKGALSENFARAIAAHSWDFIQDMQEYATAIGSATADLWLASKLRDEHTELEDNLIVGACMRIDADYLVTNDAKLMRHAPVACVTPAMMCKLLEL